MSTETSQNSLDLLSRLLGTALTTGEAADRFLALLAANSYDENNKTRNGQTFMRKFMKQSGFVLRDVNDLDQPSIPQVSSETPRVGQAYREVGKALGYGMVGRVITGERISRRKPLAVVTDTLNPGQMFIGEIRAQATLPDGTIGYLDLKPERPYLQAFIGSPAQQQNLHNAVRAIT